MTKWFITTHSRGRLRQCRDLPCMFVSEKITVFIVICILQLVTPDVTRHHSRMATSLTLSQLILELYDVQGLKFGSFTMRTGEVTPVYIDMRVIWSYPKLVVSVHFDHDNLYFKNLPLSPNKPGCPIVACVCNIFSGNELNDLIF